MPGRATPPATARRESAAHVAFIAGAGRSGSTLLERILQQFDGVVPVGELRWLWTSSWSSIVCECGQATTDCAFWAAVVERASGGAPDPWRAHVRELVERALRFRVVPSLAVSRPGPRLDADLIEIGAALARLYEAIRFVSDASTIVDASKLPLHAVAASRSDAVDLRVVHLVRNPEAVAFSWTRSVELPHRSGIPMKTLRPARSALGWLIANLEADLLTHTGVPSLRVLYEDLAESPVRATARISGFLDLGVDVDRLFDGRTLRNDGPAGHAIAGNPMRARQGPITISPDDEWRTSMTTGTRMFLRLSTGPLWHHYRRASGHRDRFPTGPPSC